MRRVLTAVAIALALAGCGPAAARHPAATASAPAKAVPRRPASATAEGPATATAGTARATPGPKPPGPKPPGTIAVLAEGFGQPDDVAVAADGTIYFSDFAGGRIASLPAAGGTPHVIASGLGDPEGIVPLPGGTLAVAEQARNRILRIDPRTGKRTVLANLVNRTRLEGVDGIAWDAAVTAILIPDSPNGRLLALDPRSGRMRVLVAAGLGRPTGAVALPGGGLVAVDETGGRVLRLGSALTLLARVPRPDDVVRAPNGALYVNSLSGTVWEVAPTRRRIATGLDNPQGLAVAADGTLVVAETGRNRLLRLWP